MSGPRPEHSLGGLSARAARLATGTLANALDEAGLPHNVMAGIHAVAPGMRLAGPAVTVRAATGAYGAFTSADFRVGAMIEAAGAGEVIVVDMAGAACSTWGGLASLAAKVKGIAGLVVDGGVRDLEEIVELGFPVFARRLVPTTGRTRLRVEAINEPVTAGGVALAPGDLVVADGTGIVCLPEPLAEELVARAEALQRDDARAAEEIRKGLDFAAAMQRFRRI